MTLKELRKQKKITQSECAKYLGVPLRTYQNYEVDESKIGTIKYEYMIQKLEKYDFVDECHGILSIEQIKDICIDIFKDKDIEYCYLFGSYARKSANPSSDVDLLISTSISGLKFYELVETLRQAFNKKIDVLDLKQLNNNQELLNQILKDGIKIYEQ